MSSLTAISTREITIAHSPDSDDAFMFYVDKDGKLIRLTESLPQTADEIERLMSHK